MITPRNIKSQKKPPLGLKPLHVHRNQRMAEILAAMLRYVEAGKMIPKEWLDEFFSLSSNNYFPPQAEHK